jgi:protein-S-isoprenylcysteine O-methyltransferase Ste14
VLIFLRTLGWVAGIVYASIPSFWFVIHPRASYWRRYKRSPFLVLLPIWFALWVVLGSLTAPWRHIVLYTTPLVWIPAVLLFATGLWIYLQSSKHFSPAQLGGLPELLPDHPEQRLVTSGIRARVRHPVYLAHLLEMLAWSVGTGLAVLYALTAFALISGVLMIRTEDAELEQRFGEEYREYRSRVRSIVPRLF